MGVQDQLTRVMSPTRTILPDPNRAVLHGFPMTCQVCRTMAAEPVTCSKCGKFGHAQCLGLEFFQDFPFCCDCIFDIIKEYSDYSTQVRRQEWQKNYLHQLALWKDRATAAMGASAAVGTAIGGAAALVVGSTVTLAKGVVTGAMNTAADQPPATPA
eukprot:7442979-Pyramimonas_sp.AAC.1